MALVYAIACALLWALMASASRKEKRTKAAYARREERFHAEERDCKNEEVRVGRPADYAAQLRLLQAFEAREKSRQVWVGANARLQKLSGWLAALRGSRARRMSYVSGLIDAGLLLTAVDRLTHVNVLSWNLPAIASAVRALL